jgi:ParB family chromosome partitioning protein
MRGAKPVRERITHDIPTDLVDPEPQVREHFDEESLLALAMTVKVAGVQQPITVLRVGERYRIVTGERRWRAAKMAGLTAIPAILMEGELSEAEIIELQLIENCAREDLNPAEKAKAYDRLMKATNRPAAEIARRVGTSPATVSKLTSLLLLAPEILEQVQEGRIPYSSAYVLATVGDVAEQHRLAREVLDGRLTRDRLIAETKVIKPGRAVISTNKRQRTPRERVVIKLDGGGSISVSAPALSVEALTEWFSQLAERIRVAGADGRPLAEVVKCVSSNGK